jgi:hypothetical protein
VRWGVIAVGLTWAACQRSQPGGSCDDAGACTVGSGAVALADYCGVRAAVTCRALGACCPGSTVARGACEKVERGECQGEVLALMAGPLARTYDAVSAGQCLRWQESGGGCAGTDADPAGAAACQRVWTPGGQQCQERFCSNEPGQRVTCQPGTDGASSTCRAVPATPAGGRCKSIDECQNGLLCDGVCRVDPGGPLIAEARCAELADLAGAILYRARSQAIALLADARDLFWIEARAGAQALMRARHDGGAPAPIATLPFPVAPALAGGRDLLYLRADDATLLRVSKSGKVSSIALPELPGRRSGLVVADERAAYFSDADCRRIWVLAHDEGSARPIEISSATPQGSTGGLAVDAGTVYCGAGPTIFEVVGDTVTVAAAGLDRVGPLAAAAGRLAFTIDRHGPPVLDARGDRIDPFPWFDERVMLREGTAAPVELAPAGGLVHSLVLAGNQVWGNVCWATEPYGTGSTRVVCHALGSDRTVVVEPTRTDGTMTTDGVSLFWSRDGAFWSAPLP